MASFTKNTQVASIHLLFIQLHFLLFLLISVIQFPLASHGCRGEERRALLDIKYELIDPSNRLASWKEGHHHENCCGWLGIGCSNDSLHVISIDLRNKDLENLLNEQAPPLTPPPNTALQGRISHSFFSLTHLEYLDLGFNNFQESKIPLEFSMLTKLRHLDLANLDFFGKISTQFSNLSALQYLDLSCTFCVTPEEGTSSSSISIPSMEWVRGLVNLQVLRLSGIDLYEATSSQQSFSEHISYLSNLIELDLSKCDISSPVFPIHQFQNLSRLSTLRISHNLELNSSFPVQLVNLTSHSILTLSYCNLHGYVPYFPQLRELYVRDNKDLHVNLTRMFQHHWPKLRILWISKTRVNGLVPSSISNAPLLFSLSASSCLIQGSLPSSFYNFSQLEYLDFSENSITGDIHSSISNLKLLKYLDLSSNNFQGSIPKSICEILPLQWISISSNNLTGSIPGCITNLKNLSIFRVRLNLIEGNVSLFSLINELNLTLLDMSLNPQLSVVMDQQLHMEPKLSLKTILLRRCNLKGLFPSYICNVTNLVDLDMSHANLTGTVPSCLFKLKYLENIILLENELHGPLPLPRSDLWEFDLANNKLSGEISIEIGKRLSSAHSINLSGNELSGSIPSTLCPTKPGSPFRTQNIDLSNNKLSGTIPINIGYCGNLKSLKLGNNNLTGKVPDELELLEGLFFLQLNNNHLDGTPLDLIGKMQNLFFLNLANNNFGGSIPSALGSHQDLAILSLRSNKFSGLIPEEITQLQKLQVLDLSLNNLTGHIPNKLWNLSALIINKDLIIPNLGDIQLEVSTKAMMVEIGELHNYTIYMDLSCNNLDGNIPEEIGSLKKLPSLNLSHNYFSGGIPESIGNLSSLGSLDLSFNRLAGLIPQSLTEIHSLGYLNLSYNMLSGKIPRQIHFDTLIMDGSALIGNDLLCGFPTEKSCEDDRDTTSDVDPTNEVDPEDAKEKLLLYAIVALGFVVGFWGLFVVLFLKKQKWWFPYWKFVDSLVFRLTDHIHPK